ncbi:hypothetical protein QWY93_04995 [Echinicola jeungdonensis]|uniref:GyrI-like small molecule binding domain-containing protein n=1 Tax=Echinicola jeungdonensis TaxID=709343 RepID=A0ABV5J5A5_9BACT|nr:hypothetical protein [Echinicola jeungdonensis]MDN3668681.1 hypothetical protein [Echinicola jeungdonensis]
MKKAIIAILIVGFAGLVAFYYLGGFNPVNYTVKPLEEIKLYGLTYRGTPQDKGLKTSFQEVEAVLERNPKATMHTIYKIEPAGKLDTMQVFVGLDYWGSESDSAWELVEIKADKAIIATVTGHRFVMSRPKKIKKDIEDYAENKGLNTQGIYIDRLLAEDSVEVIAPLEK